MKLSYQGIEYPKMVYVDGCYKEFVTLVPEPTGNYYFAKITSFGKYEVLEEVSGRDVTIILEDK